jgi:hypothetical protein
VPASIDPKTQSKPPFNGSHRCSTYRLIMVRIALRLIVRRRQTSLNLLKNLRWRYHRVALLTFQPANRNPHVQSL